MTITEVNHDGAEKYVTSLRGQLDGLRLDILCFPDGEMITKLVDEENGDQVETLTAKYELYKSEDGVDGLKIIPHGYDMSGVDRAWNKQQKKLTYVGNGYRGELFYLAAWWLMQNLADEITIEGVARLKKTDDGIVNLESLFLGESKMEAFYSGDEVKVSDGLTLQVECNKKETSAKPPVDKKPLSPYGNINGKRVFLDGEDTVPLPESIMKKKTLGYWNLEISFKDNKDYVAWLIGKVYLQKSGLYRLVIDNWTEDWDEGELFDDCIEDKDEGVPDKKDSDRRAVNAEMVRDMLALASRFMDFKFFNYEIMNNERLLEMDPQEISERTGFWLGF